MIQRTFTLSNYTLVSIYRKIQNHIGKEKATLEPTSSLKHIYTLLLIKVLFSQNQSKSSFGKFTTTTIEIYNSQYLSDYTLTKREFLILTKGLSFAPIPTKTFEQEIKKSWSKFKTRIFDLKQYFFATKFTKRHPN